MKTPIKVTPTYTILFLAVFTIFIAEKTNACRIIPVEKNKTKYVYNLIKNSADIYWAEAISFSEQDESFTFKIIEVIRGEKKEQVIYEGKLVSGSESEQKKLNTDYNSHKETKFWDAMFEGRTSFDSMCRLSPRFEVGQKYLLLSRKPFQPKSFELVKSTKDWWYQQVRNTIYPPKKKKATPLSSDTTGTEAKIDSDKTITDTESEKSK